jgi:FixJ family two-component response regulator
MQRIGLLACMFVHACVGGNMETPDPLIYIVDPSPVDMQAMGRLLRAAGLAPLEFASAAAFLGAHDPQAAGCVVVDIGLPGLDGLALERAVVFVSGRGDVGQGVRAMKAGAVDFLTKPCEAGELVGAVRRALDRDTRERAVRRELARIRARLDSLTRRERQVLRHVVAGRLNKQIASDLGIAEKTIKVHRARAMEKMGAGSLAQLVREMLELDAGAVFGDQYADLRSANERA